MGDSLGHVRVTETSVLAQKFNAVGYLIFSMLCSQILLAVL